MGRGNVCVNGPYEGLYYIDNDDLAVYYCVDGASDEVDEERLLGELSADDISSGRWKFDEEQSVQNWEFTVDTLRASIQKRFESFTPCNERLGDSHAILENNLFYIAVEDNQWSMAVMLLQKEHWCFSLEGLQKKHYQKYLDGIRDTLFEMFESLGVYGGPWTSGRVWKNNYCGNDKAQSKLPPMPRCSASQSMA